MAAGRIEGIIFDLGSTLIEFENRPWSETTLEGIKIGYELLSERDYDLPDFDSFSQSLMAVMDELRMRAISTLNERQATDAPEFYFTELGLENPKELSRWFMHEFYRAVTGQMTACEGARETLQEIKKRGYRTGLISNTPYPRDQHEADLDNFGLQSYLDFRIYSSEFGLRKPHPGIFQEGLKAIQLPPENVIYVGDNYDWDVVGAQSAGISPVLIYWEGRGYPDPMPDNFPIIYHLSELLDLLDR